MSGDEVFFDFSSSPDKQDNRKIKMKKVIVTVDLGFGDSGKGTMVDYLCRKHNAKWVVRYNGGAQAGHNVVYDNLTHTFSQFGSGTFAGANTFLSREVMWNPIGLVHEAVALAEKTGVSVKEMLSRHFVDIDAPIITPFHVVTNRIRERSRGKKKHGSCGKGIGELAKDRVIATEQVLKVRDFVENEAESLKKLGWIQKRKLFELGESGIKLDPTKEEDKVLLDPKEADKIHAAYLEMFPNFNLTTNGFLPELLNREDYVVFEGSQGVLLDEWHGFHPYTTWDTIVPTKAMNLLNESKYSGHREVMGIIRSFMTRHGEGPMPTETKESDIQFSHEFNHENEWQGNFRVGYFDYVLLYYAIECVSKYCPLNTLAITHLDVLGRQFMPYAARYQMGPKDFCDRLLPNWDHNLNYQEEMGKVLKRAKPIYPGSFMDADELVSKVQHTFGIKVAYGSFGPRASEKKEYV